MGNLHSETVLQGGAVQNIMNRIWHCVDEAEDPNAIQIWNAGTDETPCRVLDFNVNQRSGGDAWFADLLTSCREGNMNHEDYLFLHGLPTLSCGSWMSRRNSSLCGNPECALFAQ